VVSFRPGWWQAFGRGAYLGGLVGVPTAAIAALLCLVNAPTFAGTPIWLAGAVPLLLGPVTGGLAGVVFGREAGADIDDRGIHPVPAVGGAFAAWHHIEDVRVERVGGRTRIAVCFDSGEVARLGAPYDGRLLARDRQFERKLFMLRSLWENHRSFPRSRPRHREPPPKGA
jgi:hypothetical protein